MTSKASDYDASIAGTNLWWLKAILRFIVATFMFSMIALAVDVIVEKYVWDAGTGPTRMESLIGYSLTATRNTGFAELCSDIVYWIYFKWNFIDDSVTKFALGEPAETIFAQTYRKVLIVPFHEELMVAMLGAKLFGIRLASLLSVLPLFALVCVIAAIDGWTERYVRKMCAGNESSSIYHRAKHYAFNLLPPLAGLIYLTVPYSIPPAAIFVPTALVTGILLRTQMKYYKKYL